MIALIDYGAGNVGSVLKAVQYLGYSAQPAASPEHLNGAEKLILPGQGHFGQMMKALEDRQVLKLLRDAIAAGKPFLGICLGLQALYEASEEAPGVAGLGILRGKVGRFEGVFKVPHIGWNELTIRRPSKLLDGISPSSFVYYCHSYYGPVTEETTAVTEYGQRFAAVVEKDNICAVQFHPEKSGEVGLRVLRNFLEKN
jgi:imidazole glycerol phosphate synthase glutamine amidotransferase subunit